MAACLITITGTSGLLKIDYKIGVDLYSIETSIGTLYIEDTATDVTYTTISGDLVASSGCLTITDLPASCYKMLWEDVYLPGYTLESIILDTNEYSLPSIAFPQSAPLTEYGGSALQLVEAINNLNLDVLKVIGYKTTVTGINAYVSKYEYLFKILGSGSPILKVKNASSTGYIYFYSDSDVCDLTGYNEVSVCYSQFITTTTTTAAPL